LLTRAALFARGYSYTIPAGRAEFGVTCPLQPAAPGNRLPGVGRSIRAAGGRLGRKFGRIYFWHTDDAMRLLAGIANWRRETGLTRSAGHRKLRRRACAALIALASFSPLLAQKPVGDPAARGQGTAESSPTRFPLRAIEVAGNEFYDKDAIIALSGLKVGDMVTPADFQRGLERISDAGVFDSVEFRFGPADNGYKLTYTVQELGELYRFRADGFGVPAEEITQLLQEKVPLFAEKVPPTGTMVERIGNALEEFWKAKGNDSEVQGRLVPTGDDEFEMLFQPESAIDTIAFVKFENTGVLSPLDLQRSFNQVAMGVPYSETRLKELLQYNVLPLYEDKARMGAEFCPCQTEPDPETKGLLVTVHVEQGDEYTFGSIQFPQNVAIQPAQMASLLKVKEGEPAAMGKVREGLAAIEDTLKRNGYMKALARHEQRLNRDQKTVDVEVLVQTDVQYTMGNLTITGLDVVTEPAVRKRWGIKIGEPFDGGYPTYFLDQVRDMFDNLSKTESKVRVNEQKKTVDVELIFLGMAEEKKPGETRRPQ
jgi:outer membrane protein insertion porin family